MKLWRVAVSLSGDDADLCTVALVPAELEIDAYKRGVGLVERNVGKLKGKSANYSEGFWTVEPVAHEQDCAEFAREMFSENGQQTMRLLAQTR